MSGFDSKTILVALLAAAWCARCEGGMDNHANDGGEDAQHDAVTIDATVDSPAPTDDSSAQHPDADDVGIHADTAVDDVTMSGDDCAHARALHDGTLLHEVLATTGAVDTTCRPSDAPLRFYSFTVPAHRRAVFTVTPASAYTAVVRLREACGASVCVADGSSQLPGDPVRIVVDNATGDVLPKIIEVSGASRADRGAFDIAVTLDANGSGDAGSDGASMGDADASADGGAGACSSAQSVADGTNLPAEDLRGGASLRLPCEISETGSPHDFIARFYRVSVPAGARVRFSAIPATRAWAPALFVARDCSAASCDAQVASTRSPDFGYTRSAVNTTGAARDFVLVVAALAADASRLGTYALHVDVDSPATNAVCAAATVLADGVTLHAIDNGGGRDAVPCSGTALADALYYSVHVPAHGSITARATRDDGHLPLSTHLALLANCGSSTCLASSSLTQPPGQLVYRNNAANDVDLVLAMSGDSVDARSSLTVDTWVDPYVLTAITPACDDMTGAIDVLEDFTFSSRMQLPFTFTFFGEPMTSFATHGAGRIALFTDGAGPPDGQYLAEPIPAFEPNLAATIAPFWDDLFPAERTAGGGTSDVYQQTFDGPNRHVTFEFRNFSFVEDQTARVTFQTKLFTTGAIEFHYCAATGARADLIGGAHAVAGIQSSDGLEGIRVADHAAGATATTNAYRLQPTVP